ncbi:unnamed protein product [Phytophthora lilii]|uniref:RxLR effector protein n=1 Tax=Phytophthora lilii TaxID=2077276 RepID=A0A9W6U891_9STRA|nr:unnamed protein product [Phytophthora lilii]
MRFAYNVLLSTIALYAGSSSVSASGIDRQEISEVNAARALATAQNDNAGKRSLRVENNIDDEKDDDEEKGFFGDILRDTVKRNTYRAWYSKKMTPKQVKKMLRKRKAQGRLVDMSMVNGYARYYAKRQDNFFYF